MYSFGERECCYAEYYHYDDIININIIMCGGY